MICTPRKRKSERLTKEEMNGLARYVKNAIAKQDAADAIGVSRNTLDRILAIGSCKPSTADSIREILKQQ